MRRQLGLVALALALIAATSCEKEAAKKAPAKLRGSGVEKTETRPVGAFDQLKASSRLEVEVTIGTLEPMELRGDDNLLSHVTVRNENGLLILGTDVKVRPKQPLRVRLRTPALSSVAGSVGARIGVSGLGSESLTARAAGASRIKLRGTTEKLSLEAKFHGKIDATELTVRAAAAKLGDRSRASLGYVEELDATLLGNARLTYRGEPRITENVEPSALLYREN